MPYDHTIGSMDWSLTETAFLYPADVTVTVHAFFVRLDTQLLSFSQIWDDMRAFVEVRRRGDGLTNKDFTFDFSDCTEDDFCVEQDSRYRQLMRDQTFFVVVPYRGRFWDLLASVNMRSISTESLGRRLKKVLTVEDYQAAILLRDETHRREKETLAKQS